MKTLYCDRCGNYASGGHQCDVKRKRKLPRVAEPTNPYRAKRALARALRKVPGLLLFKLRVVDVEFPNLGCRQRQLQLEVTPWQAANVARELAGKDLTQC